MAEARLSLEDMDARLRVTPQRSPGPTSGFPFVAAPSPRGMLKQGNIDLSKRPRVRNADGSISTIRSMSFNLDGKEVLVPTVSDDGRIISNEEAIQTYRKTGRHLGIFDTPENATAYAQAAHEQQDRDYNRQPAPKRLSLEEMSATLRGASIGPPMATRGGPKRQTARARATMADFPSPMNLPPPEAELEARRQASDAAKRLPSSHGRPVQQPTLGERLRHNIADAMDNNIRGAMMLVPPRKPDLGVYEPGFETAPELAGTPLEGLSDSPLGQAVREQAGRDDAAARVAQAEAVKAYRQRQQFPLPAPEGPLQMGAAVAGQLAGSATSPESLIPVARGATLLSTFLRGATAAGIANLATDPIVQQAQIDAGLRETMDPAQPFLSAASGAFLGGTLNVTPEIAGRIARAVGAQIGKAADRVTNSEAWQVMRGWLQGPDRMPDELRIEPTFAPLPPEPAGTAIPLPDQPPKTQAAGSETVAAAPAATGPADGPAESPPVAAPGTSSGSPASPAAVRAPRQGEIAASTVPPEVLEILKGRMATGLTPGERKRIADVLGVPATPKAVDDALDRLGYAPASVPKVPATGAKEGPGVAPETRAPSTHPGPEPTPAPAAQPTAATKAGRLPPEDLVAKPDVPVIEVPASDPSVPINALRASVRKWALGALRGQAWLNRDTGRRIGISRGGINKISGGKDAVILESLRQLPQIIENAVLTETKAPATPSPDVRAWHVFVAPVRYGDKTYRVRANVREDARGHWYYEQSFVELEPTAGISAPRRDTRSTTGPDFLHPAGSTIKVRELLAGFKYSDGTPIFPRGSDARPKAPPDLDVRNGAKLTPSSVRHGDPGTLGGKTPTTQAGLVSVLDRADARRFKPKANALYRQAAEEQRQAFLAQLDEAAAAAAKSDAVRVRQAATSAAAQAGHSGHPHYKRGFVEGATGAQGLAGQTPYTLGLRDGIAWRSSNPKPAEEPEFHEVQLQTLRGRATTYRLKNDPEVINEFRSRFAREANVEKFYSKTPAEGAERYLTPAQVRERFKVAPHRFGGFEIIGPDGKPWNGRIYRTEQGAWSAVTDHFRAPTAKEQAARQARAAAQDAADRRRAAPHMAEASDRLGANADETQAMDESRILSSPTELESLIRGSDQPVYVRWSAGPSYDMAAGAKSIDPTTGAKEGGLSFEALSPTDDLPDLLATVYKWESARGVWGDPSIRPHFYKGRQVGLNPWGYPMIRPTEYLGTISDDFLSALDKQLARKKQLERDIAYFAAQRDKVTDPIAKRIWAEDLSKAQAELDRLPIKSEPRSAVGTQSQPTAPQGLPSGTRAMAMPARRPAGDMQQQASAPATAGPQQAAVQAAAPGAAHVGMRAQTYNPAVPTAKDPLRRESILRDFVKDMGMPIYAGRIKSKRTLGFFRPKVGEVRIRTPNDIETAAHEMAHLLDKQVPEIKKQWSPATTANAAIRQELAGVSYDASKLYEGFAEFVRLWMTQKNRAQAAAPQFYQWFESFVARSKYGPTLRRAQEQMLNWFDQAALDRGRSKIGPGDDINAGLVRPFDRFRQSVSDDLHAIATMERSLTGGLSPLGPYETARLTRGKTAIIEGALTMGVPKADADGSHSFVGKGLQQILDPVADRLDDFLMYAVGRSASELMAQGRENLFTAAEIKGMVALETPEFRQAFNEYQSWNKAILDFAEAKGIINPDFRRNWKRTQYLPFYRVAQGGGAARGQPPGDWRGIKALTGGSENLRPILGNMIQNAASLIDAALTNEARQKVAQMAGKFGGARFMARIGKDSRTVRVHREEIERAILQALGVRNVKQLPVNMQMMVDQIVTGMAPMTALFQHGQTPKGRDIVAVLFDGKPTYYEVADPLIYRALTALNRGPAHWLIRTLAIPKRIGQATVTLTLDFMARNILRDTVMAGIMSRHGFRPFLDSGKGFKSRLTADQNYREFIANGGGLGSHLLDETAYRKHLERFYTKKGINYRTVLDAPDKLLFGLERIAESFEQATRLGEFSRAIARGEHPRHAAYSAREVSTDFAMRGDSAALGFLYDTVIFLKAAINGMDRMYRGVVEDTNRGGIAAKTALLALMSAGLYAVNRGNPLYEQLDDWDRDTHWHFFIPRPDTYTAWAAGEPLPPIEDRYWHFRLPKLWEIGAIGSIAERQLEGALNGQPGKAQRDSLNIIRQQFNLDPIPQAVKPLAELAMNTDIFTGRPIEGQADKELLPFARADAYTSPTLRAAGEDVVRHLPRDVQQHGLFGFSLSPKNVQHLLEGYFNGWAMYGMTLTDAAFFDDAPDLRLDQLPVVRSFYREEPARQTRYVSELFDAIEESAEVRRTMRAMDRRWRPKIADELEESTENALYGQLNRADQRMRMFRREMLDVADAPDLAAVRKMVDERAKATKNMRLVADARRAGDDIGAIKRLLLDDLIRERNAFAETVVKDVEERRSELAAPSP